MMYARPSFLQTIVHVNDKDHGKMAQYSAKQRIFVSDSMVVGRRYSAVANMRRVALGIVIEWPCLNQAAR